MNLLIVHSCGLLSGPRLSSATTMDEKKQKLTDFFSNGDTAGAPHVPTCVFACRVTVTVMIRVSFSRKSVAGIAEGRQGASSRDSQA